MNDQLKKEARKEAFDYMLQGYSGGKDGLRCSECDSKFSGVASIVQLCPGCFVEKYIDRATLAEREKVNQEWNNILPAQFEECRREERKRSEEVIGWLQATLTALNVGDVKSGSKLHLKIREVMINHRAIKKGKEV